VQRASEAIADDGLGYRSDVFARTLDSVGVSRVFTRPLMARGRRGCGRRRRYAISGA